MIRFSKKTFVGIFIVALFIGGFSFTPQKAYAGSGLSCTGPCANQIWQAANNVIFAAQQALQAAMRASILALEVKEYVLDPAAYAVMQGVLQTTVQGVVGDIQNLAGTGAPAFVQDLEGHLLTLADDVASDLSVEVSGLNLCNFDPNFKVDLANSLAQDTRSGYRNKLQADSTCSILNAQNFYDGTSFSWDQWDAALDNPYNRPDTATIALKSELDTRLSEQKERERQELAWGDGFQAIRDQTASGIRTAVQTPGVVLKDQLNNALSSNLRSLENADELSEIVVNLISNAIANSLDADGLINF